MTVLSENRADSHAFERKQDDLTITVTHGRGTDIHAYPLFRCTRCGNIAVGDMATLVVYEPRVCTPFPAPLDNPEQPTIFPPRPDHTEPLARSLIIRGSTE